MEENKASQTVEQEELAADKKIEEQIKKMKEALSEGQIADFKAFFEARVKVLELFKASLPFTIRAHLWKEYIEISKEAKKLQVIVDEQLSFTLEQIELALEALKKDVSESDTILEKIPLVDLPSSIFLGNRIEIYRKKQTELGLFNTFAERLHGLKKELFSWTGVFRKKAYLLKYLVEVGDQIFPKRKEKTEEISEMFLNDVEGFIEKFFVRKNENPLPFFKLREEIQHLQAIAKALSLNSKVFSKTRMSLSSKWDEVRQADDIRKQKMKERQNQNKEHISKAEKWIGEFKEEIETNPSEEVLKKASHLKNNIRKLPLEKKELKDLEDKVLQIVSPINEKIKLESENKIQENKLKKETFISQIRQTFQELIIDPKASSNVKINLENMHKELEEISFSKEEGVLFKRYLKLLEELIKEKEENQYTQKIELQELEKILSFRKMRRNAIKEQLELYRKELSQSGFDFEKAMIYQEMVEIEKQRLTQVEQAIEELEKQIFLK